MTVRGGRRASASCGVEGDQVVHEQRRGVVPRVRIRRGRPIDHPNKVVRQIRPPLGERLSAAAHVGLDDLVERSALDGILAGDQVVQQDADAVDVALLDVAADPASTSGAM